MLDVHPPHEKVHGIRDFLLHVFTMTVGLFIALFLEGCMERHHKAELRQEAEENLRLEIEDNQKALGDWLMVMGEEQTQLKHALDFVAAKKAGKDYDISGIQLGYSLTSLRDASWKTAGATGALGLMDYKQVQRYAGVYEVQDEVMRLSHATFDDSLKVQAYVVYAFNPATATATDLAAGEPLLRDTLANLTALSQVGTGLEKAYGRVLGNGR